MKLTRAVKRLAKNLVYLCRHDLEEDRDRTAAVYDAIRHMEDLQQTNMVFQEDNSIKIRNDEETWKTVLEKPKSILRIGDGELALIDGKDIPFQKYDRRLAEYLKKALTDDRTDLYVGIDYNYFHGFDNVTEQIRKHNYLWGPEYKKVLMKYCNPDRQYISASFNQLYMDYVEYDWQAYTENIKRFFADREIVVFAGKGIFDEFEYNVFDNALSCEYVWARKSDAFEEFDSLLEKAGTYPGNKVLCFVLGPTAKPLVYELSKAGHMAWDLGHMAKDYDCCMRRAKKGPEDIVRFFAPD